MPVSSEKNPLTGISPHQEVNVYGSANADGKLNELKTDSSFYTICLLILTGDTARGVLFPTMWPRVQSMGGDKVTQGITVAAFSFGRVLSSPYLGRWSHKYGYTKILTGTSITILVGTIVNAMSRTNLMLIISQIIIGIGSGTLGVTRAYVAERTSGTEKTYKMSRLTAVQYTGFTVTPFFGSMLAWYFGNSDYDVGPFLVNKYTAPAYFLTFLACLCAFCLNFCFNDYKRSAAEGGGYEKVDDKEEEKKPTQREDMDIRSIANWTEVDWCILAGLFLNVFTKGSVGVYETLGVGVAVNTFGFKPAEAGYVVSTCGLIGVITLLFMKPIAEKFHDTKLMVGGILVMILSCFMLVNWTGGTMSTWRYYLAIYFMYATGYPIGHTAVLTWYSKLSKQSSEGFLQGWFGSAGSFGRIILPAASGIIAQYAGNDTLFICIAVVLGATWIFVVYFYETFTRLTI